VAAGIINVTPDSFSDGGLYAEPPEAVRHALELYDEGAAILDLGGESTRPGASCAGEEEEQARLLPVLEELAAGRDSRKSAVAPSPSPFLFFPLLSIDTWRASTAGLLLEKGADIINDISGGLFDPAMDEVLATFRPGYILGHCPEKPRDMQKAPRYSNALEEIYAWFSTRLEALDKAGLPPEHVVLDPGLGFGKTLEHNLEILRGLERLHSLGRPLCLGISRKSFFGDLLGLRQGRERDEATRILVALLAARGVRIHRVHDVGGAMLALKLARSVSPLPESLVQTRNN
jgi:dihydropteroate synthase